MSTRLPSRIPRLAAYFTKSHRGAIAGAVIAIGFLLPAWWLVSLWYSGRLLANERALIVAELMPRGMALANAVNRRLILLEGLRAFVQSELISWGGIQEAQFNAFCADLFAGGRGIRSFMVAPGGVIRYVYPPEGHQNLVGRDLLGDLDSRARADLEHAVGSNRVYLSNPFALHPGDQGVVAHLAVYRRGSVWGIASVMLDILPLLTEAGISTHPAGLTLAIRDAAGKAFHGQERVLGANPAEYRVELPGGAWTLAAVPAQGWDASVRHPLLVFRGIGLLVLGLLVGMVYQAINRRAGLAMAVQQRAQVSQRDLAERQQMEEALQVSRAYFMSIVDISEDAIISIDGKHRINLFNQGAERIFGYRAPEVLGGSLDLLIPKRFVKAHAIHVESFASSPDILRPMNERGVVFGLRKDGTEFPAEASISKFEVRGEKVMTVRLRDITERRRAEEKLMQLAAIVESSDDAIIGTALDGTISTWNRGAERLFGHSPEEVKGRAISCLMPSDRYGEVSEIYERVREGGSVTHHETVRQRKDGTRVEVSISFSPIRDASGGIVGMSEIARDATERKRLEAQMRQAQKMEAIGTLAGGIAHDFNNILSALIGYTEVATDDVPKGTKTWQNLQEVLAAGRRGKDLVQHILTFSRHREPERTPVPLQRVLKEGLKLLRASLPSTIEIRLQIDQESGLVLTDATQMHQVLMNLCTNAEHAMRPRGGILDIRLEAVEVDTELATTHPGLTAGQYVRLTVRDSGAGMEPNIRERIFDPFFTTKGQGEGTGMGLAVVHGIVASIGGVITVDTGPGRGTTFQIYLPRCDRPPTPEVPREEAVRGGSERILIIEDETFLVFLWEKMLQGLGYSVVSRTNAYDALVDFRANPRSFDVVITDQTMPQLSGETVAQEVLRIRPDIPIILCTGFSHTMTEEKAKAMGIRGFLMKPFGRRELALAIRHVLDQPPARG